MPIDRTPAPLPSGVRASLVYTFDAEGQTATKSDLSGTASYQWDFRGRLTQATLPNGQTVGYGYDALGRRASRTLNGTTQTFLYDGGDVVLDRAGANTVDYLNGAGVDEKLRQTSGIGNLYFLQDHLGSTSVLTGSTGVVVERLRYEAFGAGGNSLNTRYGYTGREFDDATGLMHYRARWYDPQQGRFMSEDPIGFAGGLNLYVYVGNNPLSFTDPSGEARWIPIGAAARGAGNIGSSMLLASALGQCYGWRDLLTDFFFMGAGKGLKALKEFEKRGGHLDDFLRYGGGGGRHLLGGLGGKVGGGIDDIGRGFGRGGGNGFHGGGGGGGGFREVPTDLHAFGNTQAPRAPRPGIDIVPDSTGGIGPEAPPLPKGASAFGDPNLAPLNGHYHVLPKGTQLPEGLGVVADGIDVNPRSPHKPTHHTIFPTEKMHIDRFIEMYLDLPWRYGGRKR